MGEGGFVRPVSLASADLVEPLRERRQRDIATTSVVNRAYVSSRRNKSNTSTTGSVRKASSEYSTELNFEW